MKVRKIVRCLAIGMLTTGMFLVAMPSAYAGDSGIIQDAGTVALTDVVDFVKHTTNSFRPSTSPYPSPWTSYQKACNPPGSLDQIGAGRCGPFDIDSSQIQTNPTAKTFTFTMTMIGGLPARGSALSTIPSPFNSLDYSWSFATTTQETESVLGFACSGNEETSDSQDDFTVGAAPSPAPRTGVKINYTPVVHPTCPSASTTAKEADGVSDGTRKVTTRADVLTPPHPAADGWLATVGVGTVAGTHGTPRLDGGGPLVCANPTLPCIDYDLSIGLYEGFSAAGQSNSKKDFDDATEAQMTLAFSNVNKTITATIPWNPTNISPDGDGLVDDARSFPWVLGKTGAKVTRFIADVSGGAGVGVNLTPIQAICTDSTDNIFPEAPFPIKEAGAAIGVVNRQIGNTTNSVNDQVKTAIDPFPEPIDDNDNDDGTDPAPADDGFYIFGTGGTDQGDCIRGTLTLLTLMDWTDNAFELRIYPRNPGYLPSAASTQCRFPLGRQGLVVVTLGPTNAPSVDVGPRPTTNPPPHTVQVNTSPYDKPYNVQVFANSTTPVFTQAGTVLPDPAPMSPLAGQVGKNQECKYTYHAPGLHYFDTLPDFFM